MAAPTSSPPSVPAAPTSPPELAIVPLDRGDPARVASWARCLSTVFLAGDLDDAEVQRRLRVTEGHRVTVALADEQVVATFRSFDSTLTLPGGDPLPVNAVSGVTVLPTHRRRRLLTRLMTADMTRAAARGAPASILIASEAAIYPRFGYGVATLATTWTVHADRARFTTPPVGSVRIVGAERWTQVAAQVYGDARHRTPGTIDRTALRWQMVAQVDPSSPGHDKHRVLAVHHDPDGVPDGAVAYSVTSGYADRVAAATLTVADLVTSTDAAYADLWRYLAEVDFVSTVVAEDRSPAEPLPWLLEDGRAARSSAVSDFLWIRIHDVPAALTARRYAVPGSLVLAVSDPLDQVTGTYRLHVDDAGGATCEPCSDSPELSLDVGSLGSLLLGGAPGTTSVQTLRRAGRLSAADDVATRTAALFAWADPAFCGTWF